jgi:hypothetical protein
LQLQLSVSSIVSRTPQRKIRSWTPKVCTIKFMTVLNKVCIAKFQVTQQTPFVDNKSKHIEYLNRTTHTNSNKSRLTTPAIAANQKIWRLYSKSTFHWNKELKPKCISLYFQSKRISNNTWNQTQGPRPCNTWPRETGMNYI